MIAVDQKISDAELYVIAWSALPLSDVANIRSG
jgi:hypothetical protein